MFELVVSIFKIVLYEPLYNALVLLYEYLPGRDFGLAVITLTVIIRLLIYPLMVKSIKAQKIIQDLQPKLQEIKDRHKNDKEKQTREMLALYKKEKINPFGAFVPILIQLPIFVALYRLFWSGLKPGTFHHLYSFLPHPGVIDPTFLGVINLAEPFIPLALVAAAAQFLQTKMLIPAQKGPKGQFAEMFQKQMLYFFPVFTVLILWKLPSALGLYWTITALFSIGQQYLILKKHGSKQTQGS